MTAQWTFHPPSIQSITGERWDDPANADISGAAG